MFNPTLLHGTKQLLRYVISSSLCNFITTNNTITQVMSRLPLIIVLYHAAMSGWTNVVLQCVMNWWCQLLLINYLMSRIINDMFHHVEMINEKQCRLLVHSQSTMISTFILLPCCLMNVKCLVLCQAQHCLLKHNCTPSSTALLIEAQLCLMEHSCASISIVIYNMTKDDTFYGENKFRYYKQAFFSWEIIHSNGFHFREGSFIAMVFSKTDIFVEKLSSL